MQEKVEGLAVVIVGAWNPAIFTPQWIANGRLTSALNVQMSLHLGGGLIGPEFTFDEIILRVDTSRLLLRVSTIREDTLDKLGEIAKQILSELSHTPVTGLGVNFQFIESEPVDSLLRNFEFPDNNGIADAGWTIETTTLLRRIKSSDRTLNHTLTFSGGKVTFDLNFHFDISSCEIAAQKLAPGVSRFRSDALAFLQQIYSLTINA